MELRSEWRSLTTARKWLYFLYAILLVSYTLPFFRAIENRMGLRALSHLSDMILITVAVVGSIGIFRRKVRSKDIVLLFALVAFHHLSGVMHVGTALYVGRNATRFIWHCLPLFLVGLTIGTKTSPKLFVGISYWALFLQIVYLYVFGIMSRGEQTDEAMTAAYNMLPYVCFLIWNAFQRGGFWHFAIAVIATFILLSLGTRGPLICLVFFIAVYLVIFKKFKYDGVSKLLIGIVALFIYIFAFEFSIIFAALSAQLGLSTRVYDSIIENRMTNIEESSGRDDLWKDILQTLSDNKIFFDFNLYADRLYTGHDSYMVLDRTRSSSEISITSGSMYDEEDIDRDDTRMNRQRIRYGWYAHNLELELLCEFGLLGGAIVICLLFWMIWRAFRLTWGTNATVLLLVFFTASIMQLQFSNSYLRAPVFWFFMGMCVAFIRSNKKKESIPLGYRLHLLKQEVKEAGNK